MNIVVGHYPFPKYPPICTNLHILSTCCIHSSASRACAFSQDPHSELSDTTRAWRMPWSLWGWEGEMKQLQGGLDMRW